MKINVLPGINILGNVDDTALMVDQMRRKFPNNFIGLVGLSAGATPLIGYIGRGKNKYKINAATDCTSYREYEVCTKIV